VGVKPAALFVCMKRHKIYDFRLRRENFILDLSSKSNALNKVRIWRWNLQFGEDFDIIKELGDLAVQPTFNMDVSTEIKPLFLLKKRLYLKFF
jgi:hypothetical protein